MPMSQEERDLIELQTQLLQQSVDATNAGNELNQILLPILLEQQGYSVTRADKDIINPEWIKARDRRAKAAERMRANEQYFARNEDGTLRLSREGRAAAAFEDRGSELNKIISDYNKADKAFRMAEKYSQRTGDIIGLEQVADPARDLREENEQLLLERQNAALRGELPVSPALLSDLDDQEAQLRESLLQNLGTGYETSTPGIEALAEFGERRNAILEATRRDDIASAGQQANLMGGFLDNLNNSRFGRTTTAGQLPFSGSSNLLNVANAANGPVQSMYNNRALDFQISQANNSPNLLESIVAQGAGAASTFGVARLFGF